MKLSPIKFMIAALTLASLVIFASGQAAHLTPEAREKLIREGTYDQFIEIMRHADLGGTHGPDFEKSRQGLALEEAADTLTLLVLLVDFSDNDENWDNIDYADSATFDSILFSTGRLNPTGSMTEFYLENSYGTMLIRGEVRGWFRMPQTYAYYVNDSGGVGGGLTSSIGLALDAITAADPVVDFSNFDTYGPMGYADGEIDGLLIVHAGPGMEQTGDWSNDMISHMRPLNGFSMMPDGITVSRYTIQPEEYLQPNEPSPIGVFCHEFGHVLGLPDLYDIDYSPTTSDGVGMWSLMATGIYKGNAKIPSQMDAWCKYFLGFVTPIEIAGNQIDVEIPQVETNPVVYKLWKDGIVGNEYFLVENRQRVGFDEYLPGEGLMIYHVDDAYTWHNEDVNHYHVAVEQADGNFNLEWSNGNEGDGGDPWPGSSGNRSFDDLSEPDSRGYGNYITQVSVWDISDSDSLMTANLDVEWSRPYMEMPLYLFEDQNDNGVLEAGETVEFFVVLKNYWLTANNATIALSSNDPGITFDIGTIEYTTIPGDGAEILNNGKPLVFTIPDTLIPTYDSFFVTVESDGGTFSAVFGIEKQVGTPQILIVDDDRGGTYEELYVGDLYNLLIPAEVWTKATAGSPSADTLNDYRMVFWFTGDTTADKLSAADITAMKGYMDNGGYLFLTGQTIASELLNDDSAFLNDYLHTQYEGLYFEPFQLGETDSPIGDGLQFRYGSITNQEFTKGEWITPLDGSMPAFKYSFAGYPTSLSFDGDYKLVFFNFGYEGISNNFTGQGYVKRDTILSNILTFFGRISTEVADESMHAPIPETFVLKQNYPNPFNPLTTIQYTIRNAHSLPVQRTELKIFNILGREIRTLVDEEQRSGTYTIEWDGTNSDGQRVSSGVYFYRLKRGEVAQSKKMLLLK